MTDASSAYYDRQYNARAMIPDHAQIFERWKTRSQAARAGLPCRLDIAYGASAAEKLDIFPAEGKSEALLVFIHGGYWRSLDKSDFSYLAPAFNRRGVTLAIPNYGLCPKVGIEDIVKQNLLAIAWLWHYGARYGVNPGRLYLAGHSAGGHLTAMMLAARWNTYMPQLPYNLLKGGLAISGIYDLEPLVRAPFVNVDLKLDQALARRLSPVSIPPATTAPLYTAVGGKESDEFKRQNALIARAWRYAFAGDIPMPDCNHLSVIEELANPGSPLFKVAMAMMTR
ncbi:MAG: alpha/beta hydrolase [Betaproteobacteria bacterium]|nr:MAG: alpha/beta hydrolase [Betaproteobacteria bacterium]